jgi:Tfp pilus assembly protein PilV
MRPLSQRQTRRPAAGRRAEAGFTILETVIALCVTLVVGLGAIGLFLFAASFNAGASDRARALAVAQQTMEELRTKNYGDASLEAGQTTTTLVARGSDEEGVADLRSFNVEKRVENDPTATPAGRQKKITVTVRPVAVDGRFSPGGVTLVMVRSSLVLGSN